MEVGDPIVTYDSSARVYHIGEVSGPYKHCPDAGEARYEVERAIEPVTLVDLDRLAELYVDVYEALDLEGRVLVPL